MKRYLTLFVMEAKFYFYGMLMDYYNCKAKRHQYNVDKAAKYAKKKYLCGLDYKEELKKH